MSYTLRGRIDSRLLSAIAPLVVACLLALGLHRWWPVEIGAVMVGVGIALDVALYHRVFVYQPGWVALPLGALELALVVLLADSSKSWPRSARLLRFFVAAWLVAQVFGHAVFPWLRLSYAEDGGELGRLGTAAVASAFAILLAADQRGLCDPATDRDAARGGREGAARDHARGDARRQAGHRRDRRYRRSRLGRRDQGLDRGRWRVRDRRRTVRRVRLDGVRVLGQKLDGIHVRFSQVMIRNCTVAVSGPYAQGIDISYSGFQGMGGVEGCDVSGGNEGIVVHASNITVSGNRVHGTGMRAITMSEMSMGEIEKNNVSGSVGVGVYCGDHSMCDVSQNVIVGMRSDQTDNEAAAGVGIEANFYAEAELDRNVLVGNPKPVAVFAQSRLVRGEE